MHEHDILGDGGVLRLNYWSAAILVIVIDVASFAPRFII